MVDELNTNLNVTLFLMRFPRSENPRCIGLRITGAGEISLKFLKVGELGSDDCLSTRMGLGLRTALEGLEIYEEEKVGVLSTPCGT